MRPVFVDNQDGNTLARAIVGLLKEQREQGKSPDEVCVASAFFNPHGLRLLAEELRRVPHVRLLLGAEPVPEALWPRRKPGDPQEPDFSQHVVQTALGHVEHGLRDDRDHLPFDIEAHEAVNIILEFLSSGRIEVRKYDGGFLHAKAYLARGGDRAIFAGSSNLTRAGLQYNLELNLGLYDDPLVGRIEEWFEDLWVRAKPYDLAAIYEELLAQYDPYLIYLKVLWLLYHDELAEEKEETGFIPVTTFQKHGVWRAKQILAKYGGVLIADGVGLGKTFIAGDIIRAYRERRQRVLLICPAALRDTSWERFLNDYELFVDRVSYEQLAHDAQLGGHSKHLPNPADDYALVIVDEAHNYRNPDAPARAAVLRRLLAGKRRDLLLLTATPVNNSLWDLYHILRYFIKQDAVLADRGVLSIRDRFEAAMHTDPYSLNPDMLYPVIDATTVKRTRRFVKKFYPNDMIRGPGGTLQPIRFPTPVPISMTYDMDALLPGFFERLEEVLMPEKGDPLLKMARYQPERYLKTEKPETGDSALVGLLRSALLKRFESSVHAFHRTVSRIARQHETFLGALKHNKVVRKEFFWENATPNNEGELQKMLDASEHTEESAGYDIDRLKADVEADLKLLKELEDQTSGVRAEDDPKLLVLVEELVKIAEQAQKEGPGDDDRRQKRKVLVFSHFEDTIDWVEDFLKGRLAKDGRLACYRGRMASVCGTEERGDVGRARALNGFAPISTGAIPPFDTDLYDLLLCTDVFAEGLNLQQCRHIINYDLPWNPMRLVQRHGRIDRIGSQHTKVFLRTFFPDKQLDALLDLEERVRRKLAQAAASVGVEDAPIEHGAVRDTSFGETREEIEKLLREDSTIYEEGGTEAIAQTGEEYRQELRKALGRLGDRIERLPWRVGSGMVKGTQTGHFFCATVGDRTYLRFVPLDGGEVVSEIGTCLRLIECSEDTPGALSTEMADAAYGAWQKARDAIFGAWSYETDPANLQPKVRKLNREVAEFLREHPPTEVEQERLQRCLDAIESPWSRREENQLREIWQGQFRSHADKAEALVVGVESIGAEPYHPPDPLPPITRDDVYLVCWLALLRESRDAHA